MRKLTKQHRENISKAMKGKMPKFIPNNKGRVRTAENKKKISETLKRKGIKPPRPPRESLCRGENHRWWKGGISPINELLRKSPEYKLWRKAVFERDNYTCIWCGRRDKTIQADHIQEFSKRPDLRFAIDNGRTLCKECHIKRHRGNEIKSDIELSSPPQDFSG